MSRFVMMLSSVLLIAHASVAAGGGNALLAIDQNRTTVVDRIVGQWGQQLSRSDAGVDSSQLRALLMGLRADHLLAASLAGTLKGLRDVVANALVAADAKALMRTKAL